MFQEAEDPPERRLNMSLAVSVATPIVEANQAAWIRCVEQMRNAGYGTKLWFDPSEMPAVQESGFEPSIGAAIFCKHYRLPLRSGEEIHVEVNIWTGRATVHLDQRSFLRDPLGHAIKDAPHLVVGGILAGFLIWAHVASKKK
ncbi:MAG: hypothetical protein KDB07_05335 [Planctomycetes bacterium]|nr:hypothetical protein [Planctomycetota bacterium]